MSDGRIAAGLTTPASKSDGEKTIRRVGIDRAPRQSIDMVQRASNASERKKIHKKDGKTEICCQEAVQHAGTKLSGNQSTGSFRVEADHHRHPCRLLLRPECSLSPLFYPPNLLELNLFQGLLDTMRLATAQPAPQSVSWQRTCVRTPWEALTEPLKSSGTLFLS